MGRNYRNSPLGRDRLIVHIRAHIRAHPYAYAALACHAVALGILFKIGTYRIEQAQFHEARPQVEAFAREAQRTELKNKVEDMAAIKALIERINDEQLTADKVEKQATQQTAEQAHKQPKPTQDQQPKKTAAKQTPEELLSEAKTISESIQKLEKHAEAAELATMLKIPEQEALKKVEHADQPSSVPPIPKNASPEQVASAIDAYDKQARDTLKHRQQRLEHQQSGTSVSPSTMQQISEMSSQGAGGSAGDGYSPAGGSHDLTGRFGGNHRPYDGQLPPMASNRNLQDRAIGRVLGAGGPYAERVIVDSWYLIGPFPDGGINTKYPPETLVDLDAVYFGKDNHPVRWKYYRSNRYPLVPPGEAEYAVYYGYTELSLDQERDVWIAFGGDDDSKVWINGQPVWVSGNQSKSWYSNGGFTSLRDDVKNWNLNEGYRRVHLKKGPNKILFKLYNGYADVFFSMVISS